MSTTILNKKNSNIPTNDNQNNNSANQKIIDNVVVNISYKDDILPEVPLTDTEIKTYIKRGNTKNPETVVKKLNLLVDGDEVEISYVFAPVQFDRIRRITGYLVGTMDRWNDAKTSEESDRVKHSVIK